MFASAGLVRDELTLRGVGVIERRTPSGEPVRRAYCLRCGGQVAIERREIDPHRWWACARGCNTRYASDASGPGGTPRPYGP